MQLALSSWPACKAAFDEFVSSGWRLDAAKGDLFANRYLASLWTFAAIAEKARRLAPQVWERYIQNIDRYS